MNEKPIYISYTTSAFGFVGRSAYQRILFPLKSFIQTMVTDDLVSIKAGTVVAALKPAGSIVDQAMQVLTGIKRALIKLAKTGNVISITEGEEISAIDLTNVNTAMAESRKNIIMNMATGAPMPAKLLLDESFAEGFGEGSEDAKHIARFVDGVRRWMNPTYRYFDQITQYRAWNPDFYKTIQDAYPAEYGNMPYATAFYKWRNSFKAGWPNLLTEPDSEKVETDRVKMEAIIQVVEALLPVLGPINKAIIVNWMADNLNENKFLFTSALVLDADELETYEPPQKQEGEEPKPSKRIDDAFIRSMADRVEAVLDKRQRLRAA